MNTRKKNTYTCTDRVTEGSAGGRSTRVPHPYKREVLNPASFTRTIFAPAKLSNQRITPKITTLIPMLNHTSPAMQFKMLLIVLSYMW